MKEIGGYFSLELQSIESFPFQNGVLLNSGRNSLEYILSTLPYVSTIWIPYYTCDAILEPLKKLNLSYRFYHINESLEVIDDFSLSNCDYLLYTNYFGVKDDYVNKLIQKYSDRVIIDNSQSLSSCKAIYSFYSPRKFVGIPDGGIAFTKYKVDENKFEIDKSYDRCLHLLKRHDLPALDGYNDFKQNSLKLSNQPIKCMSTLTQSILKNINFQFIKEKRTSNFNLLHEQLGSCNKLFLNPDIIKCPMIYPYYSDNAKLKEKLIENKIFVATYWPNVFQWCTNDSLEYHLARSIIPIPIDQRYGQEEMEYILNIIKNI